MAHIIPPDDKRCRGTSKTSGERCPMWAIKGGTVCYHHGGAAPQTIAAAKARLATQKIQADAEATLATFGVEAIKDPLHELGLLASSAKQLSEALGARVNALTDLESYSNDNHATIRAEVILYERAMDRTHRLLDSLVKHGYSERQIQIQETEALLVAGVLRRVIAGLGLTDQQQQTAQQLLAQEFRSLKPTAAPAVGRKAS